MMNEREERERARMKEIKKGREMHTQQRRESSEKSAMWHFLQVYLVNKNERVRDVAVAEVDNTEPDPARGFDFAVARVKRG